MNHEIMLAKTLSTSEKQVDEKLAQFFKMAGCAPKKAKKATIIKTATQEQVEAWGRELARRDYEAMRKEAALGALAAGAINKVGPMAGRALMAMRSAPTIQRAAVGAGAGAAIGGVRHVMKPKDPRTGQRQGSLMGSMTGGALTGGVAGLASRHIAEAALKTRPMQEAMHGRWGARPQTTNLLPTKAGPSNVGPAQVL